MKSQKRLICDEGESRAVRSMGEGAMARNHPKGPNVPQETRDTGLQPKWERPGALDGNFPEVEGWQPREIFGSGLSWSKQAPSLQGHKALPVQEQSSQGGGSILLWCHGDTALIGPAPTRASAVRLDNLHLHFRSSS